MSGRDRGHPPLENAPERDRERGRQKHAIAEDLRSTVERATPRLLTMPADIAARPLAPGKWSPIEVIGHLIDSASINHQRFVRALGSPDLRFEGYAQDAWVSAQAYRSASWTTVVELWQAFNVHLAHVIENTPPNERLRLRDDHNLHEIGWEAAPAGEAITLEYLMQDYVSHLKHHLRQIGAGLAAPPKLQRQ